ncbi:mannitol dehydrogenase family protein [Amycolatopsis ultiminotia]|uniref:Mannitol dehydrogenase family protein n=2 Tax=Amycolatopsis ultiminotia TaxID=543629 RepID=A0ABP6W2X9_9PSEU
MTGSADRPPVRIGHLGLGAFHRAHQVWFTQRSDPAWGIAAFSGRSTRPAETPAARDGVYTLVARGLDTDRFHRMRSLVAAYGADRIADLDRLVAERAVAVVTLTVTEVGYLLGPDGTLDPGNPLVHSDIAALREDSTLQSAPGPLLRALGARRRSGAGPIAVVPCDNVLGNGGRIRAALHGLASEVDRALPRWLNDHVSFVDTVADRITSATTDEDIATVTAATGRPDRAPVVTEPFAEWVLAGQFPAGRPDWAHAGAAFVGDSRPFEKRKLRLLNGAHLLLALGGLLRGHHTVDEAIADPALRQLTEQYWTAAAQDVPDAEACLAQLRARFASDRIRHSLRQIATDAEDKLRERVVPIVTELLAHRADPAPAARVISAWLAHTGVAPGTSQEDAALDRLVAGWSAERALRRALSRAELTAPSPNWSPPAHDTE